MNKGTFFEEFFTKSFDEMNNPIVTDTIDEEDNDMGKRTLTFGINKENISSKTTYDTDSISSTEFKDLKSNSEEEDSDQGENDEIQELLKEQEVKTDTNVYIDWKYNPDNIKDSEWELAYKILTTMKLKEHFVKNN